MGFKNDSGSLLSGFEEHIEKEKLPIISSGDATLDELLGGGFRKDLTYLLYGDRKITSKALHFACIRYFESLNFDPTKNESLKQRDYYLQRAAFVVCDNRFRPYELSKLAVKRSLSPTKVLNSVLVSRAFTYEQMVELLENRIVELEHVGAVFISGITTLWSNYDQQTFHDLLKAINGIKKTVEKLNPLLIITAPKNYYSEYKPVGGNILYHFGHVLVLIEDKGRYTEYRMIQHPSLPENSLRNWKAQKPKRGLKISLKNSTLDKWF